MAVLMKGADVSAGMKTRMLTELKDLRIRGMEPKLAIVRVGAKDSDMSYERSALKRLGSVGIEAQVHAMPEDVSQADFDAEFSRVNEDPSVTGVLLLRPLPPNLNIEYARHAVKLQKDVDAMNPLSIARIFGEEKGVLPPCTPWAVMEMLSHYGIDLEGKNVTIVGHSFVVGRPLALLMMAARATVTVCHIWTHDVPAMCRSADIVVSAAGKAGLITRDCVREGSIVVDVGINAGPDGHICGDADFDAILPAVSMISPVPGGVGAVTTSVLAQNVLRAAAMQLTDR